MVKRHQYVAVVALAMLTLTPATARSSEGAKQRSSVTLEWSVTDPLAIGLAFLSNIAIHESWHYLIAEGVGAGDATLKFFSQEDGAFFLGLSTVRNLPEESSITYKLGGEIAASYTFEFALQGYRQRPTTYNAALLFFSGTDLFWYTVFAFYLAPEEDARYDPVGVREVTGFSRGTLLGAASAQLAANAYRVWSGADRVVPSFSYDRRSALLNLTLRF